MIKALFKNQFCIRIHFIFSFVRKEIMTSRYDEYTRFDITRIAHHRR